jgi:hypothetical protein
MHSTYVHSFYINLKLRMNSYSCHRADDPIEMGNIWRSIKDQIWDGSKKNCDIFFYFRNM